MKFVCASVVLKLNVRVRRMHSTMKFSTIMAGEWHSSIVIQWSV